MTSDTALPVELDASDLRWIMQDDLTPTDNEIQAAAMKWCGDKDRETFASDAYYFRQNWKALDGLKAYVAREVASRVSLAEQRLRALSATRTDLWEPIETAPKDGTEIILGGKGWSNAGFYSGDEDQMRRAEAGWFFEDDRGNLLIARNIDPTHWRPLPAPPITTEGE